MVGIITADDVLDVAEEKATEEVQKLGGLEALDAPYMEISMFEMLKKRGGWLSVLLVGEMLTTTAMTYFQTELEKAMVLALFVPLIISSGGNSGSQATSLIIRALAVREITLADWWRVAGRELRSGILLGLMLGCIGFGRIILWETLHTFGIIGTSYGVHYLLVALTVSGSLVGVVLFGSLTGSMLPFLLRRLGFDPATASAPFVATLVDVSGIVIYFTLASLILHDSLLKPPVEFKNTKVALAPTVEDKWKTYAQIELDVVVSKKPENGVGLISTISCKVEDTRHTEKIEVPGNWAELEDGATRHVTIASFAKKPFDATPSSCELTLQWGLRTGEQPQLAQYCWTQVGLTHGACAGAQ